MQQMKTNLYRFKLTRQMRHSCETCAIWFPNGPSAYWPRPDGPHTDRLRLLCGAGFDISIDGEHITVGADVSIART